MLEYYNKTQVDDFLANKSDIDHTHNDLFAEFSAKASDISARIAALADLLGDVSISGYGSFYTQVEIDAIMGGLALTTHTHNFSGIQSFGQDPVPILGSILSNVDQGTDMSLVGNGSGYVMEILKVSGNIDADTLATPYGSWDGYGILSSKSITINRTGSDQMEAVMLSADIDGTVIVPDALSANNVFANTLVLTGANLAIRNSSLQSDFTAVHRTVSTLHIGGTHSKVMVHGGLSAPSFNVTSSSAFKKGIVQVTDSLAKAMSTRVYSFRYNGIEKERVGMMADEVDPLISSGTGIDLASVVAMVLGSLQSIASMNREVASV